MPDREPRRGIETCGVHPNIEKELAIAKMAATITLKRVTWTMAILIALSSIVVINTAIEICLVMAISKPNTARIISHHIPVLLERIK